MRIYSRRDFLSLPEGVIFCKGTQWCFDNLSIKGSSWDSDFMYVDLCNIEAHDSGQWSDRLEDSLVNGTSYSINKHTSRDGMFDEEAIFLVFEKEDLEFLINLMRISLKNEK
jgi:hypothetical protein